MSDAKIVIVSLSLFLAGGALGFMGGTDWEGRVVREQMQVRQNRAVLANGDEWRAAVNGMCDERKTAQEMCRGLTGHTRRQE